jgi:hypothetical protein
LAIEIGAAKEIANATDLEVCKKIQIRSLNQDRFIEKAMAVEVVDLLAFVLRGDQDKSAAITQPRTVHNSPPINDEKSVATLDILLTVTQGDDQGKSNATTLQLQNFYIPPPSQNAAPIYQQPPQNPQPRNVYSPPIARNANAQANKRSVSTVIGDAIVNAIIGAIVGAIVGAIWGAILGEIIGAKWGAILGAIALAIICAIVGAEWGTEAGTKGSEIDGLILLGAIALVIIGVITGAILGAIGVVTAVAIAGAVIWGVIALGKGSVKG